MGSGQKAAGIIGIVQLAGPGLKAFLLNMGPSEGILGVGFVGRENRQTNTKEVVG
jgi:hypothetical protein